MANVINLYRDNQCTDQIQQIQTGQAGIVGYWATPSHWQSVYTGLTEDDKQLYIYHAAINKDRDGNSVSAGCDFGITADGGGVLYNLQTTESSFDVLDTVIKSDTQTQNGGTFNNGLFAGVMSYDEDTKRACYIRFTNGYYTRSVLTQIGSYTQTPWTGTRQTWNYYTDSGYYNTQFCMTSITEIGANSRFGFAKVYSIPFDDLDCYAFFIGIDFDGSINDTGNYITDIYIIPKSIFKDKVPRPYIGPVSKESAESAFIGSRSKESVLPRDLSVSPNPYGFNRNGVYLCKCDRDSYNRIIAQMYNGLSGNLLNLAGQVISSTIGGNARRPRDEIATMIDGVLCCQSVPVLGGYPSTGSVDLTSICGYSMYSVGEMLLQTVDPIQHETITTGIIPRQTGNFLDFAPYTTVTLTIPILGSVTIDPSTILGRSMSMHFGIDLFSGVLSCDISIIEPDGTSWIYTTLQGNAVTDMPIMGAGANANPLLKIANGAMGIASGNMSNVVGGIYSIYDGIQTANYAAPISRVSHTGANLLLSPYAIYLTVTTPNNSNAADFWSLAGIPSHMSGNVGSFSGYTVFEHIDLSGVSGATDAELSEIENTLKGGVWL